MSSEMIWMLFDSFVDTCIMVGISGLLGSLFGIPLGVLLYATSAKGIAPMPISNQVVGWIVNAVRSTPFIILMVAIIPLTRFIAGTSIGTAAAIVPLTIAVTPLIARLVETSLREVDPGLVEAALAMGATDYLQSAFAGSSTGDCGGTDHQFYFAHQCFGHGRCHRRRRFRRHGHSVRVPALYARCDVRRGGHFDCVCPVHSEFR